MKSTACIPGIPPLRSGLVMSAPVDLPPGQTRDAIECPLTSEPMVAPTTLACQHTFELDEIRRWFVKEKTCPTRVKATCVRPIDRKLKLGHYVLTPVSKS